MISQDVRTMNYRYINAQTADSASEKLEIEQKDVLFIHEFVVFLIIACTLLTATYLFRGVNAQEEFAVQNLRAEVMNLDKDNARLRLDVATLEAPQRIQTIAEKKLGMTVPTDTIYGSSDIRVDQQKIKD